MISLEYQFYINNNYKFITLVNYVHTFNID
jgi:hypothetical protein